MVYADGHGRIHLMQNLNGTKAGVSACGLWVQPQHLIYKYPMADVRCHLCKRTAAYGTAKLREEIA